MNECMLCGTKTSNAKYCSRSCAVTVANKEKPKRSKIPGAPCVICGKESRTYKNKYCSRECFAYLQSVGSFNRWMLGDTSHVTNSRGHLLGQAKIALLKRRGFQCEVCQWNESHPVTGRVPVQIDHIDGDVTNNRLDNLKVLCPNHHALTPTYGSLNSAKNRKKNGLPDLGRKHSRPSRALWANG